MRQQKRREEAVSPVIGIMLMLVVTIVIAAVITGFATDLSADTAKTPMAFFEVQDITIREGGGDYLGSFGLKHKGGEAVPLKYVQLTVEQIGGAGQNGIINVMLGTDSKTRKDVNNLDVYPLTIRGETKKPAELAATTGDVIHVEPNTGHSLSYVMKGSTVKWTLSYTKTNAVIASGEFLVQ